jgi:hypothetical protein
MVKSKLTKKRKSGGYTDLYAKAVEVQSKGCTRYNKLVNGNQNSDFDRCECIDTAGNVVDAFDFPKSMFTCDITEGLKLIDNKRDPFYRKYRDLKERTFFLKSNEFPYRVEKEFMDLIAKNQELSKEVARFVIDFTLDPKEHKGRVYIDTLIPGSMQTLLNNVQAIQQGIAMVANEPGLKFNDITKLLGELITRLQEQYVKLKKLQDKHGKIFQKMDLLRKAEREGDKGIDMVNVGRYNSRNKTSRSSNNRNRYNSYNSRSRGINLDELIKKELGYLYRGLISQDETENMKAFNKKVIEDLKREFESMGMKPEEIARKIKNEDDFIAVKVVELVFARDLSVVKYLNLKVLTKFIRPYIRYYLKFKAEEKRSSKTAETIAKKYTRDLLVKELEISDSTEWFDSLSSSFDIKSKTIMLDIAYAIVDYLTQENPDLENPAEKSLSFTTLDEY